MQSSKQAFDLILPDLIQLRIVISQTCNSVSESTEQNRIYRIYENNDILYVLQIVRKVQHLNM